MLSIKYDLILLFHTDYPFKWGIQLDVKWRRKYHCKTMIPMQEISWFQQYFLLLRIRNFSNCAKEDADGSNEGGEIQREFLVLWSALETFESWPRLLCWLSEYYLTSQCHIPHPLSTSINPETNSAANRLECRGEGSM